MNGKLFPFGFLNLLWAKRFNKNDYLNYVADNVDEDLKVVKLGQEKIREDILHSSALQR